MVVFLTIHARYKDVQWGIFRDGVLIEAAADESKKVSKNFLIMLENLLQKHKLSFSDLSFIVAHRGPAPLTTLRVSLATVNGLAFATGIPLVGVNGLEALLDEHSQPEKITIALLNAFCNEVYYGVDNPHAAYSLRKTSETDSSKIKNSFCESRSYGCAPAHSFIESLAQQYKEPLSLVGNGVELYSDLIQTHLVDQARPLSNDIASLEAIAKKGLEKWNSKEITGEVTPLYLKGATP